LTLSTTVWHSGASVCSLSDILETWPDWSARHPGKTFQDRQDYLQRYYLSKKACRGILCRAEKRGRELPGDLEMALRLCAEGVEPMQVAYGLDKGGVTLEEWEAEQ